MYKESVDISKYKDKSELLKLIGPSTVSNIRTIKIDPNIFQNSEPTRYIVHADDEMFERLVKYQKIFNAETEYFICKIEGDDLSHLNIDKNSEIIIKRQEYALNGQIVLVAYDGNFLLKKYYKNKDMIFLMSGKNNVNKMDVSNIPFEIIGIVVEVISKIENGKI